MNPLASPLVTETVDMPAPSLTPPKAKDAPDTLVIRPRKGLIGIDVKELWRFRDLLFAFAWRDIRLRYRQTFLGVIWVVLQPLLGAGIFTIVFGLIAKMPSDGTPYIVLAFSGLLGWTLFAGTLARASNSLVPNADLIRKIYFPRLLLPLGIVPSTLLDFLCGAILMAVLLVTYSIVPGVGLLFLPIAILILLMMSLGIGMVAGSLSVRYRDIQQIIPLMIQLLMYASPVGYSADAVPDHLKVYYNLNPLVAPIEAVRWSLIGKGDFNPGNLVYAAVVALAVFVIGLIVFRKSEQSFADVI